MKLNLPPLCIAIVFALGLVSCNSIGGSSDGTQVKNPTVDEMAEMERGWGVKVPPSRSRQLPTPGDGGAQYATPPSAVPQANAPDPVPFPQTQSAVPPVFEQPASAATPAQIQKLKN